MLVLHSSSCCDVCLDSYSRVTANLTPHAIPCGHIFCLSCLQTLSPSNCPLCRKPFQQDRVKKLHIARPQDDIDTVDSESLTFLQRIALVSLEDSSAESVTEVLTEVEQWLAAQPNDPNSNRHLRLAVDALKRYRRLREEHAHLKEESQNETNAYRTAQNRAREDRHLAQVVEESLLSEKNALEVKLATAQSEVSSLREELARFKMSSNPLPAPPVPIPEERFPAFARWNATADVNGNSKTPSNVIPNDVTHAFHNAWPPLPITQNPNDLFKSKSHAEIEKIMQSSPGSYYLYDPALEHEQAVRKGGLEGAVIPGAPLSDRVVPVVPKWQQNRPNEWSNSKPSNHRTTKERSGARSGKEPDRMEGSSEMGRNGYSYQSSHDRVARIPAPQSIHADISEPSSIVMDPTRIASASAFVSGYASGVAQAHDRSTGYTPEPESEESEDEFDEDSPEVQEQSTGGRGIYGFPESFTERTPVVPIQEFQTSSRVGSFASLTLSHPPSAPQPTPGSSHRPAASSAAPSPNSAPRGNTRHERTASIVSSDLSSVSSWGTVNSGDVVRASFSGSISSLDLIGLPPPVPASGDTSSEASSPEREHHGNGDEMYTTSRTVNSSTPSSLYAGYLHSSALGLVIAPPSENRSAEGVPSRGSSFTPGGAAISSDWNERRAETEPAGGYDSSNGDRYRDTHSRSTGPFSVPALENIYPYGRSSSRHGRSASHTDAPSQEYPPYTGRERRTSNRIYYNDSSRSQTQGTDRSTNSNHRSHHSRRGYPSVDAGQPTNMPRSYSSMIYADASHPYPPQPDYGFRAASANHNYPGTSGMDVQAPVPVRSVSRLLGPWSSRS